MDPKEDSKQAEVVQTSGTDVPDLGKQTTLTTTREKISAYFTIAAAACGLISDGCKFHYADYPTSQCGQG